MNSEKIKRLVELLVERQVQRLLPTLKRQIINELKGQTNNPVLNETPERTFLKQVRSNQKVQQKPVYSKNPLLNELIASAKPPVDYFDPEEMSSQLFDKPQSSHQGQPLTVQQMTGTMIGNPEANINFQNKAVQETLSIINQDYSRFIKAENKPRQTEIKFQSNDDEDFSFLNEID